MKITIKGNRPITGNDIKSVIDQINEEYKELNIQIKNATCYVRLADENGRGKNVEIKRVPEREFKFIAVPESTDEIETAKSQDNSIQIRLTQTFAPNSEFELYNYCVTKRIGTTKRFNVSEKEVDRMIYALLKANGIDLNEYHVSYSTPSAFELFNTCRETICFFLAKRGDNAGYKIRVETDDTDDFLIWVDPYKSKDKDTQMRNAVFQRYTAYSFRDLALFLDADNPDEMAQNILEIMRYNPSIIDVVKEGEKTADGTTPEHLISECYRCRNKETYEMQGIKQDIIGLFYEAIEQGKLEYERSIK